jgi:hypothetical protein
MNVRAEFKVGSIPTSLIPTTIFNSWWPIVLVTTSKPIKVSPTNLAEIAKVIEADGYSVASLTMKDSHILKDAKPVGNHHCEIALDPMTSATAPLSVFLRTTMMYGKL